MSLQAFRDQLPEFARDTKINLGSIVTPEGAPGLSPDQIWGSVLACAYATCSRPLVEALEAEARTLPAYEKLLTGAKGAATVMAMNNVYYRATHLMENEELSKMPAKLRMSFIGNPGIPKLDFEVMCLAVSALNGCGKCMVAHERVLAAAEMSREGVQSALRIAAVIAAAAQVQWIAGL